MYRIHRLGHIEAKSLELTLSDEGLRKAQQTYPYLSVGYAAEITRELGLEVNGIARVLTVRDHEKCNQRLFIE